MGLLDRLTATLSGADAAPDGVREEITVALAQADRGELAQAEARLVALGIRWPDVAQVFVALGEVRVRRGDDDGAVVAFGRAVDRSSGAIDAWLGLGEVLARLGRAAPARDALRRVLSSATDNPRRARAHAGRGRLALQAGASAQAVQELTKAAELAPNDLGLAADLGRAMSAAGDPEAWQWLLRAAQAPGASVDLIVEAAAAARASPAIERLLRESLARAGVKGGANGVRARAILGAALARHLAETGRIDEATVVGGEALRLDADAPAVLAAWCVVSERAGRYDEALQAALRSRRLSGVALIRLCLGAEDQAALARVVADAAAGDDNVLCARAFVEGRISIEQLLTLGQLAPTDGARRFLARALSPGAPPEDNLLALLGFARDLAERTPELAPLRASATRAVQAFDRPLSIAVMGEFNAGKSSFINALCGQVVAPVGVTPTTATINVLRLGAPAGRVLYHDGRVRDLVAAEVGAFLGGLVDTDAAAVRAVEIFAPLELLRRMEVIDTPGLNSLRAEHAPIARAFLIEADAIVWLFAAGQAAKASEREALGQARQSGKRILGVLNKVDQLGADEIQQLRRHIETALGGVIEALLPLSARDALAATTRGDPVALAASGLPAVVTYLDQHFFAQARALKRSSALACLRRFAAEAGTLAESSPGAQPGGPQPARILDGQEAALLGAVAAERLALPARLQNGFARAARESIEFLHPPGWLGERRVASRDRDFLRDLLEDELAHAVAASREILLRAAADGPPVAVDENFNRFAAYARGVLAGGFVERTLGRHIPDADAELFVPLIQQVRAAYARARDNRAIEEGRAAMLHLIRDERIVQPLGALSAAIEALSSRSPAG